MTQNVFSLIRAPGAVEHCSGAQTAPSERIRCLEVGMQVCSNDRLWTRLGEGRSESLEELS